MCNFSKLFAAIGAMALAMTVNAQLLEVKSVERVASGGPDAMVFHPVFSPDGSKLLVTAENFDGLSVIDLTTKKSRVLSLDMGAGYKAAFTPDGATAISREVNPATLGMTIKAIDVADGKVEKLTGEIEHTNAVRLAAGAVQFSQAEGLQRMAVKADNSVLRAPAKIIEPQIFVTEEDLKVVVYNNGVRTVVDPLSTPEHDVNYCWSSLSPDGTHLVFCGGNYAYTCALDGSDLKELGKVHAPVWLDNNTVVGMEDADDGHVFTASEIVAVSADGALRQQVSETSKAIKMFPAVSADGSKIAFHTTDGELFLMSVAKN